MTQYDSLVERLEARGILQLGIDSTGAPPAPVSDLVLSVSPRQNFLKPPPVPEMPTVTLIAFFSAFWNSSATASVTG